MVPESGNNSIITAKIFVLPLNIFLGVDYIDIGDLYGWLRKFLFETRQFIKINPVTAKLKNQTESHVFKERIIKFSLENKIKNIPDNFYSFM